MARRGENPHTSGSRSTVGEERRSRASFPHKRLLNLPKKCLYLFTGLRKGEKSSRKRKFQNRPRCSEYVAGSGLQSFTRMAVTSRL